MPLTNQYSVVDAFNKVVAENKEKIAIQDEKNLFSYQEVKNHVHQLASILHDHGIRSGDRIIIYSLNNHQFIELFFASSLLNAILVPINIRLNDHEIRHIFNETNPKGIVVESLDQFPLQDLIHTVPFYISFDPNDEHDCETLMRKTPQTFSPANQQIDSPLAIIYTAATEGKAKGAVLSQKNFLMQSYQMKIDLQLEKTDVHGVFLPLYHTFGLYMMCSAFLNGITNYIIKKFDPVKAVHGIKNGVTFFAEFSPMAAGIFEEAKKQNVQLNQSLRFILGLDTTETIKKYINAGIDWYNLYGQTETSGIVITGKVSDPEKQSSYAGYPTSLCHITLRDDNGREVQQGELGEIWVKGLVNFKGYFNYDAAESRFTEDGWLKTGDLAIQKEDGSYWFQGRKSDKELIKPGGINVYPVEVEQVLLEHPHIENVCVFGVPDPEWRERVKAVIQCKDGSVLTAEEIEQFCKERLASFKRPTIIQFVDRLPKSREEVKKLYTK